MEILQWRELLEISLRLPVVFSGTHGYHRKRFLLEFLLAIVRYDLQPSVLFPIMKSPANYLFV